MKCDGSPDPTILPEINMYMSLWREDVEDIDFDTVLKESALVLKVSHCWYMCLIIQLIICAISSRNTHCKYIKQSKSLDK